MITVEYDKKRVCDDPGAVHVVFRNAYADYAVRNAAELQQLLGGR